MTGKKLKAVRQKYGYSAYVMAKRLNVSLSHYRNLENGERTITSDIETMIQSWQCFMKKQNMSLSASIDWLSLRFKTTSVEEIFEKVLQIPQKYWQKKEDYKRYGYDNYYSYFGLTVLSSNTNQDMGTLIDLSGAACRVFESELEKQQRDWFDFLASAFKVGNTINSQLLNPKENMVKCTRIDLALDEYYSEGENYNLWRLLEKINKSLIVTTVHTGRFMGDIEFNKDGATNIGFSLYFGGKQSDLLLRLYEKDYEQADKLKLPLETIHSEYGYGNRYEVKLKNDKSNDFFLGFLGGDNDIAASAVGIVNSCLIVFDGKKGELDWEWYRLMGSFYTYTFQTHPKKFDVENKWKWLEKSVIKTYKTLKESDPERMEDLEKYAEILDWGSK